MKNGFASFCKAVFLCPAEKARFYSKKHRAFKFAAPAASGKFY
jgi:hypothetical protein